MNFIARYTNIIIYLNYVLSTLIGVSILVLPTYFIKDQTRLSTGLSFLLVYLFLLIPFNIYFLRFLKYNKVVQRFKVLTNLSIKQMLINSLKNSKLESLNYFYNFNSLYTGSYDHGEYSYGSYYIFYDSDTNIFYETSSDNNSHTLKDIVKKSQPIDVSKYFTIKRMVDIVFCNTFFGKYTSMFELIKSTYSLSQKEFYDYAEIYFTGLGYVNKNLVKFDLENSIWSYEYKNKIYKFQNLIDLISSVKNTD